MKGVYIVKLVIAEKPSVAQSIANVIGARNSNDGYLEGNGYIVTWCYGHIAGFEDPKSEWKLDSLPVQMSYKVVPLKDTIKHFNTVKKLMERNDVESLVEATDAGREGEAIFRYAYIAAGCQKPFERLWVSSLTDEAIRNGFYNLRPGSLYDDLYNAAVARDFADKIIGINGTRLFSIIYNQYKPPLSVGRVQTPTLAMICERERQIENFVKEKFFKTHIIKTIDDKELDAVSENIDNELTADEIVRKCNGKDAVVSSITVEQKSLSAPKLYDLTTLQRECNRLFNYSAKETLDTVQELYEKKLCTYPRTDSKYLTDDMYDSTKALIDKIKDELPFLTNVEPDYEIKKCINNNKVSDHHAIIPTNQVTQYIWTTLGNKAFNVLSLICVRLLTATARKQIYEATDMDINCEGYLFKAKGKRIIDNGFKYIEESFKNNRKIITKKSEDEDEEKESNLPKLNEGDILQFVECKKTEHYTKPPAHFTEDSILLAMEKAGAEDMDSEVERTGLGTTATRAAIIENLINKGYISRDKKKLMPTQRAFKLMEVIPDVLKSPQITSDMENMLLLVSRGEVEGSEFLEKINYLMNTIIDEYKDKGSEETKFSDMDMALGKCPNCKGPVVSSSKGAFCKNKCGMFLSRVMGRQITDNQVKTLLEGNKILLKGLKKKDGTGTYDMYFKPIGIQDFSYKNKNNEEVSGKQFVFERSFPQRKKFSNNKNDE